jgi:glycosyltransferase involved in cell wall biosynthesis
LILFLTPSIKNPSYDRVGGGIRSNIEFIKFLSQRHEVTVVTVALSNNWDEMIFNKNVTVIKLPGNYTFTKWFVCFFSLNYLINDIVSTKQVSHVFSTRSLSINAARIKKRFKIPYTIITRAYEDYSEIKKEKSSNLLKNWVKNTFISEKLNLAYHSADSIMFNSIFLRDYYFKNLMLNKKSYIQYPTVHLNNENARVKKIRNVGFIDKNNNKGSNVVKFLIQNNPNLQFKVFGETNLSDSIAENVNLRGYIENPAKIYEQIDLLLVPSQWPEPFGRVAVEAQDAGIPVLVSDKGGIIEAVPDPLFRVSPHDCLETWNKRLKELCCMKPETLRERFLINRHKFLSNYEEINSRFSHDIDAKILSKFTPNDVE